MAEPLEPGLGMTWDPRGGGGGGRVVRSVALRYSGGKEEVGGEEKTGGPPRESPNRWLHRLLA